MITHPSQSLYANFWKYYDLYSRLSIGDKITAGGGQSVGTPGKIYFHSKNYVTGSSYELLSTGVATHICITFDTE